MESSQTKVAHYDDTVVRQFSIMAVVWGVVGMLVGVFIAAELKKEDPELWDFVVNFAKDNDLVIEWPEVCILPETSAA